MSKYVIEIEDVPFSKVHFDDYNGAQNINLYRVKGFNALVFDKDGLDKLTLLDKELDEAFQKGLEEGKKQGADKAWECAKRFVWKTSLNDAASMGFIVEEEAAEILKNYTATAAMKAAELYDEKSKTEIKVGDEVFIPGIEDSIVVVEVDGDCVDISDLHSWHSWYDRKNIKKTGRHFPQVAELFKAMKGDAE